jgi:hypothetical protein
MFGNEGKLVSRLGNMPSIGFIIYIGGLKRNSKRSRSLSDL